MVDFVFHHDPKKLPKFSSNCHPVQLYDIEPWSDINSSAIARRIRNSIRDLGCEISPLAFDFLTISMAVTAADTFSNRNKSDNSWSRELNLSIPLNSPSQWVSISNKLEKALCYLTGDKWKLNFSEGGILPPTPKKSSKAKDKNNLLKKLNCVSLFSGGLDSTVGAIDLINGGNEYTPLLVSHAYKGDALKQLSVESSLIQGKYARLELNADPHIIKGQNQTIDITMRGRSFNFLAMAVIGLSALQKLNGDDINKLFIPENGYISLNPPLTRRRIGALSTRTTHPQYLSMIQEILTDVGFNVEIINPYQFKTKGEMLKDCLDRTSLATAIPSTVSCSNWHRKNQQCGRCVPCIIRRASIYEGGFTLDAAYLTPNIKSALKYKGDRDDLLALLSAYIKLNNGANAASWVRNSGVLPQDATIRASLINVFINGLNEVGRYLESESVR